MHLGFTVQAADISIHALREEGDSKMYGRTVNDNDFYPRPPRGGRRPSSTTPISSANFYPRPPRGGRHPGGVGLLRGQNFYPRPPRGGRLFEVILMEAGHGISIHALREEGDLPGIAVGGELTGFLSTPSARRATSYFLESSVCSQAFLSTPSARRATILRDDPAGASQFLSTPSARRATFCTQRGSHPCRYFYPRPPRGGRR